MLPVRLAVLGVFTLLLLCACGPKRGGVNGETGLVGQRVAKGSLEGSWGMFVETHTIVAVPVFGDQPGGGSSSRLITRVWDPIAEQYIDTFVRCTNEIFPVMDQKTVVKPETLAKIAPSSYFSDADHLAGSWLATDTLDLWGVRDLPDAHQTPLPTKDNFTAAPQSDWMWDEDEDGQPGVTVFAKGLVEAQVDIVKRSVWTFDGTIVKDDRVQGLVRQAKSESNVVDATISWLKREGSARADPDPLTSWFDMVRLQRDATCEGVAAAVSAGTLSTSRPF